MTGVRRISRLFSALLVIAAPACAASASDTQGSPIVDASKGDSTTSYDSGADTSTAPIDSGAWDSAPVDNDTGIVGDDTGGSTTCSAACSQDSDCASACGASGGTWCCETSSSTCYTPSSGVCSSPTTGDDGGSSTGGDSGATGD